MPSICLCATEVHALYGLRLPAPEVGGARPLHAMQLGAMGGAAHQITSLSQRACASTGGFLNSRRASTAGFRTLQFKPQSRFVSTKLAYGYSHAVSTVLLHASLTPATNQKQT